MPSTDVRQATHSAEFASLTPDQLRERFLVEDLFATGELRWCYSQSDRILLGGVVPGGGSIELSPPHEIRAGRLLERRELGVVVLGGSGTVTADAGVFEVTAEDIVYVGQGTEAVTIAGELVCYLVSAPAHARHPSALVRRDEAESHLIGSQERASLRTLRKYVHTDGATACELSLGITTIEPGNVWNTMPCHTHDRRTECYLYFDVPQDERVLHVAGPPDGVRTIVVADRQAVISPPWSVHFGAGTAPYKFVWTTAGENVQYDDMDHVPTAELR